jgi:ParB family chromosome partitioning protein
MIQYRLRSNSVSISRPQYFRLRGCRPSPLSVQGRLRDPYTFTDDLAEQIAGENENEQRTAEEVLLSAIDGLEDHKLTGFALRLALIGHIDIPREGEFDFLAEAETAFAPPQPKNGTSKKPKVKTPTPIKAASKSAPKKTAAKKKTAA